MACRILIVDRDLAGRSAVAEELERRGHRVTCVAGDDLVARLELFEEGFDAVLASAAARDPLDLLRVVKDAAPQSEVVIAASEGERDDAVRALSAGAFALVRRPWDTFEVHAVVARALERRALRASEAHYQALRGVIAKTAAERLPESIVRAWSAALSADEACLLLPAPADGRLTVAYGWGKEGQTLLAPPWAPEVAQANATPSILGNADAGATPPRAPRGPSIVYPLVQDGRLVAVLTAGRRKPLFDEGDLERASVLAVHARVALENERMMRHLAASDRLVCLGQLAASIAHEIRTPLTYVIENSTYLTEQIGRFAPPPSPRPTRETVTFTQVRRAATDVVDGANRIRDIVRDIGALASADETTRVPFDVKDAVRAALRMCQVEMRGRAKVTLKLEGETRVIGSVGRLSQVFVNLFINAAHAIGAESAAEGDILVVSRREGARILVEVSDNGPGIRHDVIGRVFEPFFSTKAPGEGTGLGLFLSRDIVRRHGGELRVRSTPGRGATFVVDLPADPAQQLLAAARPESSPEPQPIVQSRRDVN
jgi:signal transduction histidine kinase/CheY-like chemotaxis protein